MFSLQLPPDSNAISEVEMQSPASKCVTVTIGSAYGKSCLFSSIIVLLLPLIIIGPSVGNKPVVGRLINKIKVRIGKLVIAVRGSL